MLRGTEEEVILKEGVKAKANIKGMQLEKEIKINQSSLFSRRQELLLHEDTWTRERLPVLGDAVGYLDIVDKQDAGLLDL